jgi:poly-gamma-glutamate capsule biosynthesis protein CapA/YwtB (metallophosphatase superfamily)
MKLALAGDTMLGRGVAEKLASGASLFDKEIVEAVGEADGFVLNLECCISDRGDPAPNRAFHFRAPPAAAEMLAVLGVDCVTLANNHALDFGEQALADTLGHLERVGIRWVGAGPDARAPLVLETHGFRLSVLGVSDHPPEWAKDVAYANLWDEPVPEWLREAIAGSDADAVLVTPHWGPNMTPTPVPHVRRAARELTEAGATLVAGHSAHVFHGVQGRVLYDLGDFIDDYRTDAALRNDRGLLWLVDLDAAGPTRLEAIPLELDYCFTRIARGEAAGWIRDRFRAACASLRTDVTEDSGRLVVRF